MVAVKRNFSRAGIYQNSRCKVNMENEKSELNKDTESNVRNFIRDMIDRDNETGRFGHKVHTRFPPEPNGYIHIGHAKSICLNSGIARDYGGLFNLRFDDTNPSKEEQEYVDNIIDDVKWLTDGFYDGKALFASDYFGQMYEWAVQLIKAGKAYVCDLTPEQVSLYRGEPGKPGKESPYRNRTVEENLALFEKMKNGEFPDGSHTLRAKIDMAHPNLNMRDPVMYRILHAKHHRQGNKWNIYPMYDWAHGLEDSIEGITHSICTLEFEDHRPLYDWFLDQLPGIHHPQQIEFARLNLSYTVMSKRKLLELVKGGYVKGWDDPRMPTITGIRRRGYTASSIRAFLDVIGVAKFNSTIEIGLLENSIRNELNVNAPRAMAVLNPVKIIIDNYPEDMEEEMEVANHPQKPELGVRKVPFSREIYIEEDDFREVPPPKYFRLSPGKEVRLRAAYIVKCVSVDKNPDGSIKAVHCTYDPASRGGNAPDGRKIKGTIHWVSAKHAVKCEVRLYETLFSVPSPEDVAEGHDYKENLNPDSLKTVQAYVEPSLAEAEKGGRWQFERLGYFYADPKDSKENAPVFNRIVTLKDTWAKVAKKN